jgi:hypothetical protein
MGSIREDADTSFHKTQYMTISGHFHSKYSNPIFADEKGKKEN